MQLGFSSNVASDTVTLTNLIKNFNFWGRLYSDSLVAKPLSNLYYDSHSNFQQSNDWQKVQYKTDLLILRHGYLYRAKLHWLKWKINYKVIIKKGVFNNGDNSIR